MYMLFAMGFCRNKHVTPSYTDVYYTTITETAMHCTKFPNRKQKQRTIVRVLMLFNILPPTPPAFFFLPTDMVNINKVIPALSTRGPD